MSGKDEADFTVKLIDKVSPGAKSARKSIMGMGRSLLGSTSKAETAGKTASRWFGRTAKSAKSAERAVGRFEGAANKLQGSRGGRLFSGGAMDFVKGSLIIGAAHHMARFAVETATATGEMVTFGQRSRMAFNQLAKHGAAPEKLFEHSRKLATRFGLDVMDTTKQYQKFLALQFSPKAAGDLIKMGSDLRILGNDAESVQGIFTAMGQIKSKGKMQAEEMMQLAERGVSGELIWEEVGKLMGGKTISEVQGLQQQGKITADIGLQAIQNAINRKLGQSKLGESGAKFADQTIEGMWGRFKAIGQDRGLTMVEKMTAPLTKLAGTGLKAFEGFMTSPEGEKTATAIGEALATAVKWGGKIVGWFAEGFGSQWGQLADGAKMMMGVFGGGDGKGAGNTIKMLATGIGEITALAVGFGGAMIGAATGMLWLGNAAWEVGKSIVDGLVGTLGNAMGGFLSWFDSLKAMWGDESNSLAGKAWDIGVHLVKGLVGGLWSAAKMPFEAAGAIAEGTIRAAKNVLGIKSPSRVFAGIGVNTGRGLAVGIGRSTRDVRHASYELGRASTLSASAGTGWGFSTGATRRADDVALGNPLPSMTAPSAGMGPRGGSSIGDVHITQHINMQGGSGGDVDEMARTFARETRREIEAYFRDLDMGIG